MAVYRQVKKIYGKPLNFKTKKARVIRKNVYTRDGYKCTTCKKEAINIPENYDGSYTLLTKDGWLEIDHIISRKNKGTNDIENLRTMCNRCNASKGGD